MEKTIQASEANRQFSRILREVAGGDTFTVTSHGRPIARIVPAETDDKNAIRDRFFEHLRKQPAMHAGSWTRDELYDD
jgi:prevent-host-death family protein